MAAMKADPKCRIHAADTEQTKHDQQVAKKGQPAERKQQADKLLANEITPNDEHPLAEREPCPQRKPADREWQSHQRNTQATAAWKAGVGELQHLDLTRRTYHLEAPTDKWKLTRQCSTIQNQGPMLNRRRHPPRLLAHTATEVSYVVRASRTQYQW